MEGQLFFDGGDEGYYESSQTFCHIEKSLFT
jgi:hypothetical protein